MMNWINTLLGRKAAETEQKSPEVKADVPACHKDDRILYQLRATGKGASVMGDVTRVDYILYSSIEKATAEIPRFTNDVTSLVACRSDAINREGCKVEILPLQVDADRHKLDHAWMQIGDGDANP